MPTIQQTEPSARLGYRPPYDVQAMLRFLRTRQLNTIEYIAEIDTNSAVSRTLSTNNNGETLSGWISAEFDQVRHTVTLRVADSLRPALPALIRRVRATLDLDADPSAINAVLAPHFPGTEGLRVPGSLDGFELAVRAVLGQQVTVAAGRTFAQRLADRFGTPITTPWPELSRLFPTPQALAEADPGDIGALGIVRQRQAAIQALARAVLSGQLDLNDPSRSHEHAQQTIEQLKTLPGIGDWTAQYIALRALRWPDAFPAGDVALHKALGVQGHKKAAQEAEALSQAWRPWRSYAVLRAWKTL
jgi:AraC family transcriptional regulator, regulatory protein of adaptative response / DNA-3-methyladenine glycosylase II